MTNNLLLALTGFLYTALALWQIRVLFNNLLLRKMPYLSFSFLAITLHGYLLYRWIDVGAGQNLTFFNLLSLVLWLIALLTVIAAITKPVESLSIILFPLTALSILLVKLFPGQVIFNTAAESKQLVHILLSTAAFGVLGIAAFQAVFLAVQEQQLRSRQPGKIMRMLPPLETMESLLFQMITLGFFFLTLVMFTSFWFFKITDNAVILPKALISVLTWLIFAVLLFGRKFFGWRSVTAIRWTLIGMLFLVVAYFGSRLLFS